jgi:uncharacterized protein
MNKRIVLAGGSGFLGRIIGQHLQPQGFEVVVLTRRPSAAAAFREVAWDGRTLGDWRREVDGATAMINLAGRSVNCRFTPENKRQVMQSRVESTRVIGHAIAESATPPPVWLNCSTATIYRHALGAAHDETSQDFTPTPEVHDAYSLEVAHAWESALWQATTPRTRRVAMRISLVFGTVEGGVFQILRRLAKLGLGGRMASGQQYVSWIHEHDFVRAVQWILEHEALSGPVNLAAPNPVTNAEMMRFFRRVCGIPIGLPAARWMLEIGAFVMRTETELLLKSRRVVPGTLLKDGFKFQCPEMEGALRELEQRLATKVRD